MKKIMTTLFLLAFVLAATSQAAVIITGVLDGQFPQGIPKAVELYVSGTETLDGLYLVNYNSFPSVVTTPTNSTTLTGTYTNTFVYVMPATSNTPPNNNKDAFNTVWRSITNKIVGLAPSINGDDTVALVDISFNIIDIFGVIGVDGTGSIWEYMDSYAYKKNGVGASSTFNPTQWNYGGVNLLDSYNDITNTTMVNAFAAAVPFGTYDPNGTEPNVPTISYNYGWENFDTANPSFRETVLLSTFNKIQAGLETTTVRSGTKALSITEDGTTSTGQGNVAWIKNLLPGDYVKAVCYGKSYAGSAVNKGVRMWAHYTYDNGDINSFAGTAAGCETYSDPNNWVELSKEWLVPQTTYTDAQGVAHAISGMIIEVRTYSTVGDGGFVDDLRITVPDRTENTVSVVFPSMTGDAICVGGLPSYDLNNDCKVDLLDFMEVAAVWLNCNLQPSADCNL